MVSTVAQQDGMRGRACQLDGELAMRGLMAMGVPEQTKFKGQLGGHSKARESQDTRSACGRTMQHLHLVSTNHPCNCRKDKINSDKA